jgi:hypothetical protein
MSKSKLDPYLREIVPEVENAIYDRFFKEVLDRNPMAKVEIAESQILGMLETLLLPDPNAKTERLLSKDETTKLYTHITKTLRIVGSDSIGVRYTDSGHYATYPIRKAQEEVFGPLDAEYDQRQREKGLRLGNKLIQEKLNGVQVCDSEKPTEKTTHIQYDPLTDKTERAQLEKNITSTVITSGSKKSRTKTDKAITDAIVHAALEQKPQSEVLASLDVSTEQIINKTKKRRPDLFNV